MLARLYTAKIVQSPTSLIIATLPPLRGVGRRSGDELSRLCISVVAENMKLYSVLRAKIAVNLVVSLAVAGARVPSATFHAPDCATWHRMIARVTAHGNCLP